MTSKSKSLIKMAKKYAVGEQKAAREILTEIDREYQLHFKDGISTNNGLVFMLDDLRDWIKKKYSV